MVQSGIELTGVRTRLITPCTHVDLRPGWAFAGIEEGNPVYAEAEADFCNKVRLPATTPP